MPKVYKLLRNNRESGPFTIGELLQQPLQPSDLLWLEGQSTAWMRLADMELLPQSAVPVPRIETTAVTTMGPLPDDIESKAAALRERVLAHQPAAHPRPALPGATRLSTPPAEEGIDLVDHRRQRSRALSDALMTLLAVALFAGGLYASRSMFRKGDEVAVTSPAVVRIMSTESNAAKPAAVLAPPVTVVADTAKAIAPPLPRRRPVSQAPLAKASQTVSDAMKREALADAPAGEKLKSEAPPVVKPEEMVPSKAEPEQPKESVSEEGKKKGLGQALKNIFKKKKAKKVDDHED